jgi:hypothetical protein
VTLSIFLSELQYAALTLFAALSLVLAIMSETAAQQSGPLDRPFPLEYLAGTWEGTKTITATGSCMLGRQRETSSFVIMDWVVGPSGELSVQETIPGHEQSPSRWSGHVHDSLKVTLVRQSSMLCGGEKNMFEANYSGGLATTFDLPSLEIEAYETWCPHLGCKFLVHYSLVTRGSYQQRIASFRAWRTSVQSSRNGDGVPR